MDSERLFALFRAFAEQLPSLLTLLACLVFALTRVKRFPKVALGVAIACGLLLVHAIVFTIIYNVVPPLFIRSASPENIQQVIQNVYLVIGLISNTVAAIGFAVLLAAIFMMRKPGAGPAAV